jgi:hypothetical protein
MEKGFWVLINKVYKKELELLYGKNSSVEFDSITYSEYRKCYMFRCRLIIGETNLFEDLGESGLSFLINKSLRFMGMSDDKIILQISFDLL